jgi:hypothetical protein
MRKQPIEIEGVLRQLIATGEVEERVTHGIGRHTKRYRAVKWQE